ncbi:MAG: fibronectin type III domain-containing protein, partial [bacterium]
ADVPSDEGGALRLTWTANTESDLKDYRIRRSTGTGITAATAVLATVAAPGTTHQDAGLANGTTQYYRLTARDTTLNDSAISASDVGASPVDNLAPAAPSGLAVADVPSDEGGALRLTWTANPEGDLKDYTLYRATSTPVVVGATFQVARVATPGTTHQDAGLNNGATYYYRLTARDASLNESGGSAEASSIPSDNTAPAAPTGLAVADVPADQGFALRLTWTANPETDLKDYRVSRATFTGALGTKALMATIASPGTTQQDAGLVNGQSYYYQLTARDVSLNESAGGTEAFAAPADNLAPAAPTGLGVADVAGDQGGVLNVSWTANSESDLKDYRVRRSTGTGVTAQTAVLVTIAVGGTTHQDGGLATGTTYYYRLTARDVSLNESAISGNDVGTFPVDNLLPAAPVGLGVVDVAGDQGGVLNVSWTANTEADLKDYRVRRSTGTGITAQTAVWVVIPTPGTTHQDAGLANGTTYYYRLTA